MAGSRARYNQLYAGAESEVADFAATLRAEDLAGVRVEDQAESGSQLGIAIDRAGRFLSLASLISLILAAVAVAMSARRYADRRLDSAALMKTFGAPQSFVLQVGLAHLLAVGAVACVLGVGVGYAAERALSAALSGWLRGDLPAAGWSPVLPGVATALVLLVGFGLPALLRLGDTPPLRVLRHDLAPPAPAIWLTYGLAVLSLGLIVAWAVPQPDLLAIILGGTVVTMGVLMLAGRLLVAMLGSCVARSACRGVTACEYRATWRRQCVQVVAFGLGLMVLLLLTLVRNDLIDSWSASVPDNAPNQFLINIQPDERDSVRAVFEDAGLGPVTFVPLVRGRIDAVNDVPAAEWQSQRTEGRGRVGREMNLSWTRRLDSSNTVTAGAFWPENFDGAPQVSIDEDVAANMGLTLGDTLSFDFAGESRVATVTSFRRIDWDSFRPNFFMVLSPGGMSGLPQTYITSLYIPEGNNAQLLTLVRQHPSVTVIDIDAALAQVRGIIAKATLAVQYVFLFTLAAGVVVLFAAVQSTLDQRRYESALLRTFGASQRTVLAGIWAEFSALGLLAGVCAATGATVIGMLAARTLFDLPIAFTRSCGWRARWAGCCWWASAARLPHKAPRGCRLCAYCGASSPSGIALLT